MKNIKKKKTSKKINNVLMVLKILEKYSDKSCFISHQQINEYIKKEYGYELKRQTIGSCIDNLIEAGYGIIKKHKHGSAYVNRNLKTEEGYFLIDAVYSSGSISRKQAKELTTKISNQFSLRERIKFELHKTSNIKKDFEDLFSNMKIIADAIKKKKEIKFKYRTFNEDGILIDKHPENEDYYHISPFYIINSFNKYYVMSFFSKHPEKIIHFRIEYMHDIEVLKTPRLELENLPYGINFDLSKYLDEHLYPFGGKVVNAKAKLLTEKASLYVKDWFGTLATFSEEKGEKIVTIRNDESALFYWALQYIEDVQFFHPKNLVDKIKNTLKISLENYNKN